MNSLTEINKLLDDNFYSIFYRSFDDTLCQEPTPLESKDEDIQNFEEQYMEMYFDYIDEDILVDIKKLCNFDTAMKICEYVANEVDDLDKSYFDNNDKMLKAYVFIYMETEHHYRYIETIEDAYKTAGEIDR